MSGHDLYMDAHLIWPDADSPAKRAENQPKEGKEMGYMTDGLTFNVLRNANVVRRKLVFGPDEEKGNGLNWTPCQWLQALVGEVGEYANLRKKFERGDFMGEGNRDEIFTREAEKELADIQIYLDLLALSLGIDLGQATIKKYNEVSKRHNMPVLIQADGSDYYLNEPSEDDLKRLYNEK